MLKHQLVLAAITAITSTAVMADEIKNYYAHEMKDFYVIADRTANGCKVVDVKPTPAGTFSIRYDTVDAALASCSAASTTGQGSGSSRAR